MLKVKAFKIRLDILGEMIQGGLMDGPVRQTRLQKHHLCSVKGCWLERRSCLAVIVHLGISYQVNCEVVFFVSCGEFECGESANGLR